jgi:hypothetical protein
MESKQVLARLERGMGFTIEHTNDDMFKVIYNREGAMGNSYPETTKKTRQLTPISAQSFNLATAFIRCVLKTLILTEGRYTLEGELESALDDLRGGKYHNG